MAYFKRRKNRQFKSIPMTAELQAVVDDLMKEFRLKFGRDPQPDEPLFFNPDADTPQFMSSSQIDDLTRGMLEIMASVGTPPHLMYATKKTGRIVTQDNWHLLDEEEQQEWKGAVEEYCQLVEKQKGHEQ